jgi:hypothetical protein
MCLMHFKNKFAFAFFIVADMNMHTLFLKRVLRLTTERNISHSDDFLKNNNFFYSK